MKDILYIVIPIIILVVNEFFKNKIFAFFQNSFFYSKYILLAIPFILIYINPDILKKLLIIFKDIDNKPVYQNINDLMVNYFDQKNNNHMKMNNQINMPQRNTSYYRNVPNYYQSTQPTQQTQQTQPTQHRRNNFLNNPNKKVKRNVSESKKKYIASNQKWQCAHCHNLLDNTYEVDHIIALYRGGNNELNNLEALCRNCHGKKKKKEKMGL